MCVNFSKLKQEAVVNFCKHLVDTCRRKGMVNLTCICVLNTDN